LIVKSEDDGAVLLESKVHAEDIYQRQQGIDCALLQFEMNTKYIVATLIVWNEPDTSVDLALSFQESEGCQEVWYFIHLTFLNTLV
jgi:protein phosphatase-4 regulatory subunit 3